MVLRKRQRQPCPCSRQETTETESQQSPCPSPFAPTETTTPTTRRRQRRCGPRKLAATSWKMTMATLLLWLCGDNSGYNRSGQSSSSLVHAWGSSSSSNNTSVHTTKKGLQIVSSCSKEEFQVQAVYLLCDSPGAYYRGSSTYRDSTTCIYGDKARLQLQCKIHPRRTSFVSFRQSLC